MRPLTIDQAAGAFFTAFSLGVLWETRRIPFGFLAEPGPGAMPTLLAFTLLAALGSVPPALAQMCAMPFERHETELTVEAGGNAQPGSISISNPSASPMTACLK